MITRKIVVQGLVQGIGFRPFAAELAEQLHIVGWVRNTDGIVTILATGEARDIDMFVKRLACEAPTGAVVMKLLVKDVQREDFERFSIMESQADSSRRAKQQIPILPADLPTCKSCEAELHDKSNRRFHHPFISCTACGPRYSILCDIPYDRESISMREFAMCPACRKEYSKKGNVRRHAQTIACNDCGPKLTFLRDGNVIEQDALQSAILHLWQGGILAVKDIGGYHLAASPFEEDTIKELRRLKGRQAKPFAVMFPRIEEVREYCKMDEQEEELLTSAPRPIVLLKKRKDGKQLHDMVCTSSPDIGAMLPSNPVQILLAEAVGALIMTSANVSGELMTTENAQMESWLSNERVAVLSHDRAIVTPLDDSVVRVVLGKKQTLRRARGFVPQPIPFPIDVQCFAAGGDLKACFCHTAGKRAYLSQHLGDLMEESCYVEYEKQIARMRHLFGFAPEMAAYDMHPAYRSVGETVRDASGTWDMQIVQVQHHKAHVASVIAEHGLMGEVLGFAFDGTGYGEDDSIWGSEVFVWNEKEMKRVAHLMPVTLIGGDEGAKNADTILYGYLCNLPQESTGQLKKPHFWNENSFEIVKRAIRCRINCVQSTSMGRLFDAVSAFLDICHYNSYEGQAPVELENLAATTDEWYPLAFTQKEDEKTGQTVWDASGLFCDMTAALWEGHSVAAVARGFLYAVADAVVSLVEKMEIPQIALSGGTFLNRILLERVTTQLEEKGFTVYRNEEVPPGDGGICLGQAYLAAKKREEQEICV